MRHLFKKICFSFLTQRIDKKKKEIEMNVPAQNGPNEDLSLRKSSLN